MSVRGKLIGAAAGAAGAAVAGGAAVGVAKIVSNRRLAHRPSAGDEVALGSLHSEPITVLTDDGVPLHAEIDDYEEPRQGGRKRRTPLAERPPFTVVFVHGYCLDLDCWHFQRAAYRGLVRAVYYDHRSHGRSGRSDKEHETVDQLGRDLKRVLEDLTGDDPVVLVGHSMGGMTIMALAEQFPELFGEKVIGVGLISTTAGGLDPGRILFPMLPAGIGAGVMGRTVRTLRLGHRAVDQVRRFGRDIALTMTDLYAFGSREVPADYLRFVYEILSRTPFDVVAGFYPGFAALDKWDVLRVFSRVPTSIICGTSDKLTSIGHSRKMHSRIHGSDLLEVEDAGHLVLVERHEEVNEELDDLLARVFERLEA